RQILYCHGNAGSLRTWGEVAQTFLQRGYDVLIFDYRGFGKSTGRLRGEKDLLADGAATYNYLKTRYPENRIVIYGRSIGTGIAVWLGSRYRPRMVVLESPYDSLVALAAHHYPFVPKFVFATFLQYPLRSDVWIKDVTCPIIIFHGTRDDIIPFGASEKLARDNPGKVRLITVERGGHNDLEFFPVYNKELDRLLR
ncbi:MAG: lysophospholipase, partial [Syntrophales bacterium]|nr:lysophospholipase [Syntrophales bacterium]